MKISVISDIHDHIWNLQKALSMPELQATEAMLFCGDLCSPFVIHLLGACVFQSYPYGIGQ